MNWMIDGLYGDDYRTAMGYRPLTPHAHDEWEIERQTAAAPRFFKRARAGIQNTWARGRTRLQTAGIYASAKERDRIMRDYALNRAMAAESIGTSIMTLFRNWRARSEMAKLANCDDQILRDLGIIRDEVRWALRLPLSQNPRLALEERAFIRSRH